MGKYRERTFRIRAFFDDHRLLNNSQLPNGVDRFWIHLEPTIVTFADLASYIREKFTISNHLILLIDDFTLPPFLPTSMLEDTDIIRIKLMNVNPKDALMACDGQKIVQDPKTARADGFPFNNNIMPDEKSQANLQGNGGKENVVHGSNLSLGIGVLEQKEHSLEVHNSMRQAEGINSALESEPHLAYAMTKENVQSSAATSKGGKYCCDVNKKESSAFCMETRAWIDKKAVGDSPDNKANTALHKIDFATLFPLTRAPLKGDILAYRYVDPSSTVYPVLSSPQAGKVSAFDYRSAEIILVPAPEFEIFSEENPNIPISSQRASPYKEDGSLEIKLSALIDVRLVKACNSEDLECLPEGTFNRTKKGKWEAASAGSNWNQSDAHYTGRGNGAEYIASGGSASTPWFHGTSPASSLFWETVLSKGNFVKRAKCSPSGKY